MPYKSPFIQKFDSEKKTLKVRKRLDIGYTSFFPGEAVIPEEIGLEPYRIKVLWRLRWLENFDPEDNVDELIAAFKKKLRILRAGEKIIGQKVG